MQLSKIRFDWRWLIAIGVIAVLANAGRIPWPITALVVGGSGVWLLTLGWRAWERSGGVPSRSRVTYWRGQRIEVAPPRRGPALPRWGDIRPAGPSPLSGRIRGLGAVSSSQ